MGMPMNSHSGRSLQLPVRYVNQFLEQGAPPMPSNIYQPGLPQFDFTGFHTVAQPSVNSASLSTTASIAQEIEVIENPPPMPMFADEWGETKSGNRCANADPSNACICTKGWERFEEIWILVKHENNSHPPLVKPGYPKMPERYMCAKCKEYFNNSKSLEQHEDICFLNSLAYPYNWSKLRAEYRLSCIHHFSPSMELSCDYLPIFRGVE
jgi:hypothetical protein